MIVSGVLLVHGKTLVVGTIDLDEKGGAFDATEVRDVGRSGATMLFGDVVADERSVEGWY